MSYSDLRTANVERDLANFLEFSFARLLCTRDINLTVLAGKHDKSWSIRSNLMTRKKTRKESGIGKFLELFPVPTGE